MVNSPNPHRTHDIHGTLFAWSEMHTEGIVWALHEDGKKGYDGLNIIETGDILTVFRDEARTRVLWRGEVNLDLDINKAPHRILGYPVQAIFGATVHGLQKDVPPRRWAEWFGLYKDRWEDSGRPATLTPRPSAPAQQP